MKSVALLEQWQEDNLASMNPFERYLYENGLLDDRIRPEITTEDVILEPTDLVPASTVSAIGSAMGGFPIAPSKCHTNFKVTDVPYNHCSYMGCVNCPEVVSQGVVVRTAPAHTIGWCSNLYLWTAHGFGRVVAQPEITQEQTLEMETAALFQDPR